MPTGESFDISEGPGSAPSVAGGESHFVVAYLNASAPGQDGEIRARYLDGMGSPVLHRGPESTTGSFQIQAESAFDVRVAANDNHAMFAWRDRASEAAGDITVLTLPLP